jgi:hypothetical protein
MISAESTVEIKRDPDDVFAPSAVPSPTSSDSWGSGEVVFELIEYEPNRLLTRQARSGAPMGMRPRISISLVPTIGGTKVTRRVEAEPQGLGKLMSPMMARTMLKYNVRSLNDLKKVLEAP